MKTMFLVLLFLIHLPLQVQGRELRPWFGRDKEFECRGCYHLQSYDRIDQGGIDTNNSSLDHFLSLSLAISPFAQWSFEGEATVGATDQTTAALHLSQCTLRYLLCNDVIGDCISLALGSTLFFPTSPTRRDWGTSHVGSLAGEVHVALGKETVCHKEWDSRGWGVFWIGVADQGEPWWGGRLVGEKRWGDCLRVEGFVEGQKGWGTERLTLPSTDTDVYGEVDYAFVDLGVRGVREVCFWGEWYGTYAYRVYGSNHPTHLHKIEVGLLYTFGL